MRRAGCFLIFFFILLSPLITVCEVLAADTRTHGMLIIGDDMANEIFHVGPGDRHFHTGPVVIKNSGLLLVQEGEFHIDGDDAQIAVKHSGKMVFVDSFFHMKQSYINQHTVAATQHGSIEFYRSTISADGSIDFYVLNDNSRFLAENTTWLNWSTWYPSDQSSLTLNNVTFAGDIVISDAPTITIKDTSHVMPWLQFPRGAWVNTSLPKGSPFRWSPVSKTINNSVPGFFGIPWTLEITNTAHVLWGIQSMPGSDVTIRNSELASALFAFMGNDTFVAQGDFKNDTFYRDQTFSLAPDRKLNLVNTHVRWWKIDPRERVDFRASDIIIAEMMLHNNAKARVTNSICEGQTVHVGTMDSAYLHWRDGQILTHVSAWGSSTMVLENTIVDWTRQKILGTMPQPNLAHNASRLYCLNTEFVDGRDRDYKPDYLPEAKDSAVVMYEKINYPVSGAAVRKGLVNVLGSAWIETGADNLFLISFDSYELSYQRDGDQNWTVLESSRIQMKNPGRLAVWDTRTLSRGSYKLRLKVYTNGFPPKDPTENFPLIVDNIVVR